LSSRDRKPSEQRPPDLEIGATVRAKGLRFSEEPDTEVRFRGESVAETESGSERQNLPDEVEAGVTYRNVHVGWRAAAWVENAAELEDEAGGAEDTDG
jgi:hypothetical protein